MDRKAGSSEAWQSLVEEPLGHGERLKKVEAAPGSGKTTALREWCRARPNMQAFPVLPIRPLQKSQGGRSKAFWT